MVENRHLAVYNERTSVSGRCNRRQRFAPIQFLPRPCACQANGRGEIYPRDRGEGDRTVSNCNPIRLYRNSAAENSTYRPSPLTPAEKTSRVAELRSRIHASAFQAKARLLNQQEGTRP
jgi:hypothetical protein